MPIKFSLRVIPLLAVLVVMAIGITAGQWQMRRAAEKEAIEQRIEHRSSMPLLKLGAEPATPEAVEYRKIIVHGEFLPQWTVYLDNRPLNGVAGFYVAMPMRITGSDTHVLVLRGWAPRDPADRFRVPEVDTPAGPMEIVGIARQRTGRLLQLGDPPPIRPGSILLNVDIDAYAQATGLKMQPVIIEQTSDTQDHLLREWPRPTAGIEKHLGYAFQWYGLAATALIFYLVTGFRRGSK
jgi:surfeit locus 1 family protein